MKQEDKDLLLKDLCGRLPYDTQVYAQNDNDWYDSEICTIVIEDCINGEYVIKPYLFPLSSMTEEQYNELGEYLRMDIDSVIEYNKKDIKCAIPYFNVLDWYNRNHFDYRNLIPMGLAIDATGKNIY